MSRVWVVFPSYNQERLDRAGTAWLEAGYEVFVWIEDGMKWDVLRRMGGPYPGYWCAVNRLALDCYRECHADLVIAAADDILPDPTHRPEDLAQDYFSAFPDGRGIMQPTGDNMDGTDRICGSPWIGRRWALSRYGNAGPYHPGYGHFFGDEEMFEVAKRDGLLIQRPDVVQRHEHWCRRGGPPQMEYQRRNSDRWWDADKALFAERKAAGFPGAEETECVHEPAR